MAENLRKQAEELLRNVPEALLKGVIDYLTVLTGQIPQTQQNVTPISDSNKIIIYTDGGCHGNPGPGGWGAVVLADGDVYELSGGENLTTNNRMELSATINALSVIVNTPSFAGKVVEIFTDSQYVKNGITSWIINWKRNNWTRGKNPVKNVDLWKQLDELNSKVKPQWTWVKGHAGVEYNEVCDRLCQKEIAKFEK